MADATTIINDLKERHHFNTLFHEYATRYVIVTVTLTIYSCFLAILGGRKPSWQNFTFVLHKLIMVYYSKFVPR